MTHTVDRLLSGVKRRAIVPASQPLLSDSDILEIADDIVESYMVPLLLGAREEYLVKKNTVSLTVNVAEIDIPYRAIGRALREIKIVGSTALLESVTFSDSGDTVNLTAHGLTLNQIVSFTQITSTTGISVSVPYYVVGVSTDTFQVASAPSGSALPLTTNGYGVMQRGTLDTGSKRRLTKIGLGDEHLFRTSTTPQGFYVMGDKLYLVPAPSSTGLQLELFYNLKPSRFVKTSDAALVDSISMGTITCAGVPTTITAGSVVDFVQGIQGNSILGMDVTVTSVAGNQIVFNSSDVPSTLIAGDYISLACTSPVVQLPDELYSLLETYLCQRVLVSLGDFEGADRLSKDISETEKRACELLQPRIIGEPTKVVNRSNLLRGSRSRFRYGWMFR